MLYRIGYGLGLGHNKKEIKNILYKLPAPSSSVRQIGGVDVHDFDGDDFIDLGLEGFADGTSLFAISSQSWSVSMCGIFDDSGYLVARAGATSTARTFGFFHLDGDLRLYLRGENTTLPDPYVIGDKIRITVTWDGTQALVYKDDKAPITASVGTAVEEIGQRIIIGARSNGTGFMLDGAIQDVIIDDHALNATEVAQRHTAFG